MQSKIENVQLNFGCLRFILFLICLSFFVAFLKNCFGGRGIYESTIQTAKDYTIIADSIWSQ